MKLLAPLLLAETLKTRKCETFHWVELLRLGYILDHQPANFQVAQNMDNVM